MVVHEPSNSLSYGTSKTWKEGVLEEEKAYVQALTKSIGGEKRTCRSRRQKYRERISLAIEGEEASSTWPLYMFKFISNSVIEM